MSSWFTGWNPIKYFPDYNGPHAVGTVDVEIPISDLHPPSDVPEDAQPTVAFRMFYPCVKPSSKETDRPVRWIPSPQRETVASFAKFLGLREKMAGAISYLPQQLYWIKLPAHRNAKLLDPPTSTGRWPVTVFSHGLAGSRNAYSQICGELASNGVIVIALDHRDGSSPIQYVRATASTDAHIVDPVKISHNPITQEVYDGRDKQLRIRLWEICLAYEALMKIDAGQRVENLDRNTSHVRKERVEVLWQFADMLDIHRPGKVTWAGHSFGAATTVQLLKTVFYNKERTGNDGRALIVPRSDAAIVGQVMPESPTLLLDMWGLPLQSPDQKFLWDRPLPSYAVGGPNGSNVLSILSEAFQNWEDNLNINKHIIAEPSRSRRPSIAPRLTREKGKLLPPWARLRAPSPSSDSGYMSEISRTSPSPVSRQRSRTSMRTTPSQSHSQAISQKSSTASEATAQRTEGPHMFYTQMSQHFNQSDFGVLFPWIAKRVTKAEEPERVIELNIRAMVQVLRENDVEVSGEDDREILAKQGGVRRWVNIAVSDNHATDESALMRVDRKLSITSARSVGTARPPQESMTMGQRTISQDMVAQLEMRVPSM